MSIATGSQSLSLTTQNRAWLTNIETPFGKDYTVTQHRYTIGVDADGVVRTKEDEKTLTRTLDAALFASPSEKVTLDDGTTLTTAQIVEAVKKTLDRWAQE